MCPDGAPPDLLAAVSGRCAYYHAGLGEAEQKVIEHAFCQGHLRFIAATTSLSEGVNLPVRVAILSSLYIGMNTPLGPTKYKQMVGRAGRKGFESEGFAYVLVASAPEMKEALALVNAPLPKITSQLIPAISRPTVEGAPSMAIAPPVTGVPPIMGAPLVAVAAATPAAGGKAGGGAKVTGVGQGGGGAMLVVADAEGGGKLVGEGLALLLLECISGGLIRWGDDINVLLGCTLWGHAHKDHGVAGTQMRCAIQHLCQKELVQCEEVERGIRWESLHVGDSKGKNELGGLVGHDSRLSDGVEALRRALAAAQTDFTPSELECFGLLGHDALKEAGCFVRTTAVGGEEAWFKPESNQWASTPRGQAVAAASSFCGRWSGGDTRSDARCDGDGDGDGGGGGGGGGDGDGGGASGASGGGNLLLVGRSPGGARGGGGFDEIERMRSDLVQARERGLQLSSEVHALYLCVSDTMYASTFCKESLPFDAEIFGRLMWGPHWNDIEGHSLEACCAALNGSRAPQADRDLSPLCSLVLLPALLSTTGASGGAADATRAAAAAADEGGSSGLLGRGCGSEQLRAVLVQLIESPPTAKIQIEGRHPRLMCVARRLWISRMLVDTIGGCSAASLFARYAPRGAPMLRDFEHRLASLRQEVAKRAMAMVCFHGAMPPFHSAALPQRSVPQRLPPRALLSTAFPSTALRSTAFPSQSAPFHSVPFHSAPFHSVPLPQRSLPQRSLPQRSVPQRSPPRALPSTAFPSTALRSTALPSTAFPSTAFPSTALPSTAPPLRS